MREPRHKLADPAVSRSHPVKEQCEPRLWLEPDRTHAKI